MGREQEEDQTLGIATTSKKLLVEEMWYSYIDWHWIKENGEPWMFILNLPLDDDDKLTTQLKNILNYAVQFQQGLEDKNAI